jgi:PAS domain S-box-containing protein
VKTREPNVTSHREPAGRPGDPSRSAAALRAVRVTAERLFGSASWEEEVESTLERVGLAAELSRVSVVERAPLHDGSLTVARIFQWNAPGVLPIGEEVLGSDLAPTDGFTEPILEAFRDDECVEGTAAPLQEPPRSLVGAHGARAFALARILVDGELWGMVMFDDCAIERRWDASELDALRAVAGLLGAAIGRERTEHGYRALVQQTEGQLAKSRGQLQTIVDAEPECVKVVGFDGSLIAMNPAGLAMIEADDLDEVRGKDVSALVVEDDRPAFREAIREASSGGSGSVEFEIVGLKGTHRWLETKAVPLRDESDQIEAVLGVTRDVSERHHGEAELRQSLSVLRALSEERRALLGRLDRAQEDERARISEDIHDDSIQAMTALGFRLEHLARIVSEPEALETIDRLKDQVSEAIGRLRRMMFELRPPVLDDGLAPAIRAFMAQMSEQTGIDYGVESTMTGDPGMVVRSILYRIAQEALVNVRKHSGARRVDIGLSTTYEGYAVRIIDDGKGLDVNGNGHAPDGHLGLSAMRDRAERAGGWWRIESSPGMGTTVEFVVPEERPT